jgi:hypothetical protein
MSAIRIRTRIDSDTLTLPELRPFIGRTVEIIIEESAPVPTRVIPGSAEWNAVLSAAQTLEDYDYEAQSAQDASDLRDVEERFK